MAKRAANWGALSLLNGVSSQFGLSCINLSRNLLSSSRLNADVDANTKGKDMENSYLFVYGSLRKHSGHPMSLWLAQQANYICQAKLKGDIYQVSYYPALVQGDGWIEGDVYACPRQIWPELDAFEETSGINPEYERRLTPVLCDTGQWLDAWVYWYLRPITHLVKIT